MYRFHCANCGGRRTHDHRDSNRDRDNYCQACRNNDACHVRFCKWCGGAGCTEHGMSMTDAPDRSYSNSPTSEMESPSLVSEDEENDDDENGQSYEADSDHDSDQGLESKSSSSYCERRDEKTKCGYCMTWFDSKADYDTHQEENSSGCAAHEECFPHSQDFDHAQNKRHSKCFVPNCNTKYAVGSWDDSAIEKHVWDAHTQKRG